MVQGYPREGVQRVAEVRYDAGGVGAGKLSIGAEIPSGGGWDGDATASEVLSEGRRLRRSGYSLPGDTGATSC